jgi:hypothetical protein
MLFGIPEMKVFAETSSVPRIKMPEEMRKLLDRVIVQRLPGEECGRLSRRGFIGRRELSGG